MSPEIFSIKSEKSTMLVESFTTAGNLSMLVMMRRA